jgi:hypothetical protein
VYKSKYRDAKRRLVTALHRAKARDDFIGGDEHVTAALSAHHTFLAELRTQHGVAQPRVAYTFPADPDAPVVPPTSIHSVEAYSAALSLSRFSLLASSSGLIDLTHSMSSEETVPIPFSTLPVSAVSDSCFTVSVKQCSPASEPASTLLQLSALPVSASPFSAAAPYTVQAGTVTRSAAMARLASSRHDRTKRGWPWQGARDVVVLACKQKDPALPLHKRPKNRDPDNIRLRELQRMYRGWRVIGCTEMNVWDGSDTSAFFVSEGFGQSLLTILEKTNAELLLLDYFFLAVGYYLRRYLRNWLSSKAVEAFQGVDGVGGCVKVMILPCDTYDAGGMRHMMDNAKLPDGVCLDKCSMKDALLFHPLVCATVSCHDDLVKCKDPSRIHEFQTKKWLDPVCPFIVLYKAGLDWRSWLEGHRS